eukprot:jgi/Orpsp1_1/1179290/evm.model.c7180000068781.1
MIIYGLSCCSISFILSLFINKSKTATTVSTILIALFLSMIFLNNYIKNYNILLIIFVFTVSPISLISLFNKLLIYEENRIFLNIFNVFFNSELRNNFLGLLFTFNLYLLVAIYLDNVIPQGNNMNKKWHFFITDNFKNNKKGKLVVTNPNHVNKSKYIEEDLKNMKKAAEIKNVSKTFKVKGEEIEILKNIDFNGYYNEIFAILGHNGAGKTTLINIMIGILSSSYGEVYYDGVPITGNETEICKQFGYCPQFDTFNNNFSVGEHIKLFSGIKGIKVDVDSVLEDIDLLNKKNNFPNELSGGQKRKLCITLALLGSPKYVFLDEPTTGLDPYSRKNIWELLLKKKERGVMFVTTHYMDEADLLADRKMILSNGNITCLGTSIFLKQLFNMTYSLDIHYKKIKDSSLCDKFIEKFCPGASETKVISETNMKILDESSNKERKKNEDFIVSYALPIKYSYVFKDIFENINKIIKDHGNSIENFSLTAPTLEELFIKLESSKENDIQYNFNDNETTVIDINSDNFRLVESAESIYSKKSKEKSSSLLQLFLIVKLRLKLFIRSKTFALLYILLPVMISIFSIYLLNLLIQRLEANEPKDFRALNMSPLVYENDKWFKEVNLTSPVLDYISKIETANKIKIDTISYINDLSISSGRDRSKENYVGGFYGYNENENQNQNLRFVIYQNSTCSYAVTIAINCLSNAILELNNIKERFSMDLQPFRIYDEIYEDRDKIFNISPEFLKNDMEPILIV